LFKLSKIEYILKCTGKIPIYPQVIPPLTAPSSLPPSKFTTGLNLIAKFPLQTPKL